MKCAYTFRKLCKLAKTNKFRIMRSLLPILFLSLTAISLSNCAASRQAKQLAYHNELLTRIANSDLPPEKKLDALGQSFTNMMGESLKILNPKKGVAYVKKYDEQNSAAIDKIFADVSKSQENFGTLEKIAFGAKMIQMPWTRDLVGLIPKFENKFNQIKFILGLTNKLKGGLLKLGGKAIGL